MDLLNQEYIAYALIGSAIPTIFWLWFWMRRDRFCPEPKFQIFSAFMFGALAALFALMAQAFISSMVGLVGIVSIVLLVSAEEYIKYICCWYNTMKSNPYYNERIDPIIYLSTTALGFATLENILYFVQYLNKFELEGAFMAGGKRIIGATILHMTASGVVGIFLALTFRSGKTAKLIALCIGLACAIGIHSLFNVLVTASNTDWVLVAFGASWLLFIIIVILLELIRPPVCPPDIDWQNYDA